MNLNQSHDNNSKSTWLHFAKTRDVFQGEASFLFMFTIAYTDIYFNHKTCH